MFLEPQSSPPIWWRANRSTAEVTHRAAMARCASNSRASVREKLPIDIQSNTAKPHSPTEAVSARLIASTPLRERARLSKLGRRLPATEGQSQGG